MAEWTTEYVNDLPDSAFAVILPGGEKDSDGKTVPRSLRKLPHHNASGALDMPHLRNAMSRAPQTDMGSPARGTAMRHLEGHMDSSGRKAAMDMPANRAEMAAHLEAEHDIDDASDMSMDDMMAMHDRMHEGNAGHSHGGMSSAASPMKAEQLTGSKWRLLAIPFGGPFKGELFGKPNNGIGYDLDGEYFDAETDVKPHWFKARPVIFHHGEDRSIKDEDLGEQELDPTAKADGWWSTVWLNRAARYWAKVDQLLRSGDMYGSSGALSHLVRMNRKSGHIEVWPHAEQTLTLTPINPYSRIAAAKAVAHFDEAGLDLPPAVRGLLSDLDSPQADLGTDLPDEGGDDPAMARLAGALSELESLLRTIPR